MEKFFRSKNILDLPATIQLGKIWCLHQQLKCSSERKISSVPVFKQDPQKPGKCITVIQNIL